MSITKRKAAAAHRWDVVGRTVEEILKTRFSSVQQLAAAYKLASGIRPQDAALYIQDLDNGTVVFYFDVKPELKVKH